MLNLLKQNQRLVENLLDEEKDILYGGLIPYQEARDIATGFISTYNPHPKIRRYHNSMLQRAKAGDKRAVEYVKFLLYKSLKGHNIGGMPKQSVIGQLVDNMFGLDILAPLWADPTVEEIRVNRYDDVRVSIAGESQKTDIRFRNSMEVFNLIKRLTVHAGTDINYASPHIRCKLYDGSRLTASIEPEAENGFVLRKHNVIPPTTEAMLANGTVTPELVELLRFILAVDWTTVIGGKTNSGKTHTLRWMLTQLLPDKCRVVTAERVKELHLVEYFRSIGIQKDIVEFEEVEQIGRTLSRILEGIMRYSPDKIIVGESLGREVRQMLDANRRGHPGGLNTLHSFDERSMFSSLMSMYSEDAEIKRDQKMMETEIAETVDVYIQQSMVTNKDNGDSIQRQITKVSLVSYDYETSKPNILNVAKLDKTGRLIINPERKLDPILHGSFIERVRQRGYSESDLRRFGLM
ncbi:putative conjugal transfer protein [compost metagenome]